MINADVEGSGAFASRTLAVGAELELACLLMLNCVDDGDGDGDWTGAEVSGKTPLAVGGIFLFVMTV